MFNSTVIMILLVTGILGTALAFGGQVIAQKDTTPTHTALIFTAEPVFAAMFAMIIPNAEGKTETLGDYFSNRLPAHTGRHAGFGIQAGSEETGYSDIRNVIIFLNIISAAGQLHEIILKSIIHYIDTADLQAVIR